jgi:hypothetical protein
VHYDFSDLWGAPAVDPWHSGQAPALGDLAAPGKDHRLTQDCLMASGNQKAVVNGQTGDALMGKEGQNLFGNGSIQGLQFKPSPHAEPIPHFVVMALDRSKELLP